MKNRFDSARHIIRHPTITVYEPRYIERKESVTITKFGIFPPDKKDDGVYLDEQQSHAIYDIEIINSNGLRMGGKT
jgi:hypothetical protein